jgi:hypothetical protein
MGVEDDKSRKLKYNVKIPPNRGGGGGIWGASMADTPQSWTSTHSRATLFGRKNIHSPYYEKKQLGHPLFLALVTWSPSVEGERDQRGNGRLEVEDEKTRGSQGSIHISLGCAIEQHTIPSNYLHCKKKVVSICLLEHEILNAIQVTVFILPNILTWRKTAKGESVHQYDEECLSCTQVTDIFSINNMYNICVYRCHRHHNNRCDGIAIVLLKKKEMLSQNLLSLQGLGVSITLHDSKRRPVKFHLAWKFCEEMRCPKSNRSVGDWRWRGEGDGTRQQ